MLSYSVDSARSAGVSFIFGLVLNYGMLTWVVAKKEERLSELMERVSKLHLWGILSLFTFYMESAYSAVMVWFTLIGLVMTYFSLTREDELIRKKWLFYGDMWTTLFLGAWYIGVCADVVNAWSSFT